MVKDSLPLLYSAMVMAKEEVVAKEV
jgi:hypothetical protein